MTTTALRLIEGNKSFALTNASFADVSDDAPFGSMECLPSVYGNLDSYNDVIFPGAFKKCLAAFMRDGFNPLDHKWEVESLVGYPIAIEDRGSALWSRMAFHSTDVAQNARRTYKERLDAGKSAGVSVGFMIDPANYKYFNNGPELLAYAKKNGYNMRLFDVAAIQSFNSPCQGILESEVLKEYSLTPAPANTSAIALTVKSSGVRTMPETKPMRLHSICGDRTLDIAPLEQKWSPIAAEKRVREWAGATDSPNAKYAKAFMAVQGDNEEFSSYHLLFCDVVNGELVAVQKAIEVAAHVLNGTRAGAASLPDEQIEGAKRFTEDYLAKAARQFEDDAITAPWLVEQSSDNVPMFRGQFLGNYVEYSMCMSAISQANYALQDQYCDAMTGYGDYGDMSEDEIDDSLDGAHAEHKALCKSVYHAIKSGNAAETPAEAVESAKRMMMSMVSAGGLVDGLPFEKHAKLAVDAARMMVERAKERADKRRAQKSGRELSDPNRAVIQGMCDGLEPLITEMKALLERTETLASEDEVLALRLKFEKIRIAA